MDSWVTRYLSTWLPTHLPAHLSIHLQERVGEMRSSYIATKDDGPAGVMLLMPEGSGASAVCCVM